MVKLPIIFGSVIIVHASEKRQAKHGPILANFGRSGVAAKHRTSGNSNH